MKTAIGYAKRETEEPLSLSVSRLSLLTASATQRNAIMNDYEQRQEERRERYEKQAEKLRAEAGRLYVNAREMASVIPLGQPILVGHYSEGRDRRYRDRIHNTYGKAFSTMEKAEYYERKAESVGRSGISSDDPDAILKLKAKLAELEKLQETMKQANARIRKHKTPEAQKAALLEMGMTEAEAADLLTPSWANTQGFMPFQLSNNNANIRRIRLRIEQLERAAQRVTRVEECAGYTYREDAEENRIMFIFEGKPEEGVRTLLKTHGFKWSPRRGAWVRMLNGMGRFAAQRVRMQLDKQE